MLFISLNSWKPLYRNDYCMISTGKAQLFWDLQQSLNFKFQQNAFNSKSDNIYLIIQITGATDNPVKIS